VAVRRCDDTIDKKRVNSWILKHLFLEGVEQPKISPKTPGNALSGALLMSRFQNFAADAAKKKSRCVRLFETTLRAALINELIQINSGPKILRSCFLHCLLLETVIFMSNNQSNLHSYSGAQNTCLVHATPTAANVHKPVHARLCRRCSDDFAMKTITIYPRIVQNFILFDGNQKTMSSIIMTLWLNKTSNAKHAG